MKSCGSCAHGMAHEIPNQVYCIAHPATPLWTPGRITSHWPSLMTFAKCDEFTEGTTQPLSAAPLTPLNRKQRRAKS